MDVFTRYDFARGMSAIRTRLQAGEVALLPSDTEYGLTASALDPGAVRRLVQAAHGAAVSLIPHSLEWARLLVPPSWAETLPGILQEHRRATVTVWHQTQRYVQLPRPLGTSPTLSLRYPETWIARLAAELGLPLAFAPAANRLDGITEPLRAAASFLVHQGPFPGAPVQRVELLGKPRAAGEP